jgi:hypothetical protein
VRAALTRLFESFTVARAMEPTQAPAEVRDLVAQQDAELTRVLAEDGASAVDADRWVVMPVARPEVVAGVDETWRPILRRKPLVLSGNNDAEGLPTASVLGALFGPIPVERSSVTKA